MGNGLLKIQLKKIVLPLPHFKKRQLTNGLLPHHESYKSQIVMLEKHEKRRARIAEPGAATRLLKAAVRVDLNQSAGGRQG